MRRTLALLAIVTGLIFAAGQSFGQLTLTGAGKNIVAGGGGNAVTFENAGTGAYSVASNHLTITGFAIAGGLTNSALVVVVANSDGTSMTSPVATLDPSGTPQNIPVQKNQDATGGRQVVIFGLRSPASGTQSITVTWTGTVNTAAVNVALFSHVDPSSDGAAFPNCTGANSGAAPISITITTGTNNYAIAGYSSAANFSSVSDTQFFLSNSGSTWAVAGNYKQSTGATDTLTGSPGSATTTQAGCAIAHD